MSKFIFLICPVRNATETQKAKMAEYINALEDHGNTVYYPARDTNQTDDTGLRICKDNRAEIIKADEVHVFWDKTSTGSHFDIGMAFALNKPIILANKDEIERTEGKSYNNMILAWESAPYHPY